MVIRTLEAGSRDIGRRVRDDGQESRHPEEETSLGLVFVVVSVIASRMHGVSRYVIRHGSAKRICADAAGSEVNAAEDACIGDFRYRVREARKRSSARTYIGGHGKRGVLSKRGGEDERGRTTNRGMARRVFWMCRSAGREKIQPWHPGGVGIRGCETRSDGGDRPPEDVAVLAIPACNGRVGHGDVEQRKQMRILGQSEFAGSGKLRGNTIPVERSVPSPEQRELRLIRSARRP